MHILKTGTTIGTNQYIMKNQPQDQKPPKRKQVDEINLSKWWKKSRHFEPLVVAMGRKVLPEGQLCWHYWFLYCT